MKVKFFLIFFIISFFEFAGAKTICTITINSKNEINVFKKFAPKGDRFIELTQLQTDLDRLDSWLENACHDQVQCDTLIISGHFAGTFFGNKNIELELNQLKNASCKKKCHQLFENTKEVYLFGCNTLSQIGSELTNLDLYFNDLIRSGYSETIADRLRSNIIFNDGAYINTMRSIFSNADLILGFDDKAPLGSVIEKPLTSSMQSKSSVEHFSLRLKKLVPHIKITNGLKLKTNPFCGEEKILESKESQLEWLNQAIQIDHKIDNSQDLKLVSYNLWKNHQILLVNDQSPLFDMDNFVSKIESLYLNTSEQLIDQKLNYLEILVLFNPEKYQNIIQGYWKKFNITENQKNFSYQDTEIICKSKFKNVYNLKSININLFLYQNKNFLLALGCLLPQDRDIQKQLVRQLESMDLILANTAYFALNNYKFDQEVELKADLINVIRNSYSPRARKYAERLLSEK